LLPLVLFVLSLLDSLSAYLVYLTSFFLNVDTYSHKLSS
jgi:hypothetical protein